MKDFVGAVSDPPAGQVVESPDRFSLMALPGRRSSWADVAFYLGWLSVFFVPAPLALAAGIVGLRELRRVQELTGRAGKGKGRAAFGLIAGLLGTLVLMWFIATAALT